MHYKARCAMIYTLTKIKKGVLKNIRVNKCIKITKALKQ